MKKTISTFIKASVVTACVMGVVTLNAWWCQHCQRNHRGRVCPVTGNTQYGCGPAYGCWERDVDSDDEEVFIQDIMRRRQARAQEREDKIFNHLRRHGSVAELNRFVRKTQEVVENRGFRMVVDGGGFFQVVPQGPLPGGFRIEVVRGNDVPPPPYGCHHPFGAYGCADEFGPVFDFPGFGCHEDFVPPPPPYGYGCYPDRDYYGCGDPYYGCHHHHFGDYGCRY
ncbi:MAG: hypothetical protein LBD69_01415 [Puniceicoccales bacterium]|nr:hypothetical protein [Puniceicoccales bacterium]